MKRLPVFVSFVLFIVLCISATYWTMQLFKAPLRVVAPPPPSNRLEVKLDAAAALFGGRPASVAVASNFQLKGVVVANRPSESVAILTTDGKPPQAVYMNMEVTPGVTIKEVHAKYVLLNQDGVTKRVELPEGTQARMEAVGTEQQMAPQAPQPNPSPMAITPVTIPPTSVPPSTMPPSTMPPPTMPAPGMTPPVMMPPAIPPGTQTANPNPNGNFNNMKPSAPSR